MTRPSLFTIVMRREDRRLRPSRPSNHGSSTYQAGSVGRSSGCLCNSSVPRQADLSRIARLRWPEVVCAVVPARRTASSRSIRAWRVPVTEFRLGLSVAAGQSWQHDEQHKRVHEECEPAHVCFRSTSAPVLLAVCTPCEIARIHRGTHDRGGRTGSGSVAAPLDSHQIPVRREPERCLS